MRSVIHAELCKRHGASSCCWRAFTSQLLAEGPPPTTTRPRRRAFSVTAASPLDDDHAGNQRTEQNRHHDWRDEPLMQSEFLDGEHTDRPRCGGRTSLSDTDSSATGGR